MPSITNSLLSIALVLFSTGTANAATCAHKGKVQHCGVFAWGDKDQAWEAREKYCGGDLWKGNHSFKLGRTTICNTNPGAQTQQVCWDALQDIIDSCGKDYAEGSYDYIDTSYRITSCEWDVCPIPTTG